ncbi:MAG: DUF3341 domain-containing protein [Candidatus Neomarinimicrobiota bacterium]|nr:MAG: DUF3341 domain-containing protein [Candidatus Neomarinimicrobiota bacterium]
MSKVVGVLGQFRDPTALVHGAEAVRDAGYKQWDTHSPFPIHGMDQAMGMKRSGLGYFIGLCAFLGAATGFGLQSWAHAIAYPAIIAGKPLFAWQAYIVITFALLVLFGAIGSVIGMLLFNRLPRFHHPVFYSDRFESCSDDGFFISIEADDPQFDQENTVRLLKEAGALAVDILEETDE